MELESRAEYVTHIDYSSKPNAFSDVSPGSPNSTFTSGVRRREIPWGLRTGGCLSLRQQVRVEANGIDEESDIFEM